jgi:hypothetical protein
VGRLPALFHGEHTMQTSPEHIAVCASEPQRKSLEQGQPLSLLRRLRPRTVAVAVAPAPEKQSHGQSSSLLRRLGRPGAPPAACASEPQRKSLEHEHHTSTNESRWRDESTPHGSKAARGAVG